MEATLSTRELAALAGITERMLRWWVDRGLVKARQPGHAYAFDERQALKAMILGVLRRRGLAMHQLRRWKLLPARADYLIVMGGQVHWFAERGLIRRLERVGSGCLVVDVRELREMLQRRKGDCNAVSPLHRRIAA